MTNLRDADRNALVLRFLEERSFAEVAKALGTSEPAAKMRVGRALEKLRDTLGRSGLRISGTALFAALSAHSGTSLAAGTHESLASLAVQGGAGAPSSALGLMEGASKSLAWAKAKSAVLACLVACTVLTLGGSAFYLLKRSNGSSAPLRGFAPLGGNWAGTFRVRSALQGESPALPAQLSIKPVAGGRDCRIEMSISNGPDRLPTTYRFTHQLNERRDRIITEDDPQVARSDGEGVVTQGFENPKTGEWHLAFRTTQEDSPGFSECTWTYKNDELRIVRNDSTSGNLRQDGVRSELNLRRAQGATNSLSLGFAP